MARTVGDLFIRVTAKDQQFKKQMRGVRASIGSVGSSVGRMAGLFGIAFGGAAALGFALKAASKYSGVFVQEFARFRVDMVKIKIAAGKAFGPVFANILKDIRGMTGETQSWDDVMHTLAETAQSLYDIFKALTIPFKLLYKLGEQIGNIFTPILEAFAVVGPWAGIAEQRKQYGKGMTREDLTGQQTHGASSTNFATGEGYGGPMEENNKISAQMLKVLERIEQTGTPG